MSELIQEIELRMKRHFEQNTKSLTDTIRKHIIRCASDGDWNTWVLVDDCIWDKVAEAFREQDLIVTKVDVNKYKSLGLNVNMKISWKHLEHQVHEMLRESTVTISKR